MGAHSPEGRDNTNMMTCSRCGAEFDLSDYTFDSPVATLMREGELCHHCAFWKEILEYPEQPFEIIDGKVWLHGSKIFYTDNASITNSLCVMHNDESVIKLEYPNCIGDLPDDLKDEYPNTARFIDSRSYKRIRAHVGMSCRAVGCYDRYHCYWYDVKLREARGAWNEVPKSHKVGSEKCPSFVDKEGMFIKINTP